MADRTTINELVKDIHNSVQDSSTTAKTTQELVREIRDAVANGVISEQEVRDLIIGNAPQNLDTLEEVAARLTRKYTPNAFLMTDTNGDVVATVLNDADNTMYGG